MSRFSNAANSPEETAANSVDNAGEIELVFDVTESADEISRVVQII